MPEKVTFFESFKYAWHGIAFAFRHNRNMRVHIVLGVLALFLGYFLKITDEEFGIIAVMIVLVLVAEMINTAIEEIVNLITKDHRIEAKLAKDAGAGMVLLTSILATVVGAIIFIPPFLKLFH